MVLSEWPPAGRAVTGVFPTLVIDGSFFVSHPTSFLADRKIVITTHGVLRNHYLKFGGVTWGRFVVDEAHVMRNKATVFSAKFDAVAVECMRLLEMSRKVSASMPTKASCNGVVVFCNWIMEMDLLEAFIRAQFKEVEVCIECANCGLNMQHAFNNVVMMRPQWNPVTEYQAIRRVLRRGQERTVRVLLLVAKDSVDEQVLERQMKKTRIIRDAMQDDVIATTLGALSLGSS
eukprot:gene17263-biopygen26169